PPRSAAAWAVTSWRARVAAWLGKAGIASVIAVMARLTAFEVALIAALLVPECVRHPCYTWHGAATGVRWITRRGRKYAHAAPRCSDGAAPGFSLTTDN